MKKLLISNLLLLSTVGMIIAMTPANVAYIQESIQQKKSSTEVFNTLIPHHNFSDIDELQFHCAYQCLQMLSQIKKPTKQKSHHKNKSRHKESHA